MQSDFQRTFLMMRPLDAQDSASTGFIRVERRGNRGKIVFHTQGLSRGDELHAALISQGAGEAVAVPVGSLRVDARGNGKLEYVAEGLTPAALAALRTVAILREENGALRLVMAGLCGKGKPLDRAVVERLATRLWHGGETAVVDTPVEEAVPAYDGGAAEPIFAAQSPQDVAPTRRGRRMVEPQETGNSLILTEAAQPCTIEEDIASQAAEEDAFAEEEPLDEEVMELPENIWAAVPEEPGELPALGLPQELEGIIWPDSALPLRELFERFDVVSPVTGRENEVFVSIPMSGGLLGIDHYLLGVRLEQGAVSAVGYAIPGTADAPPAGLVGYTWTDTPLGGYWIKWESV